MASRSARVILPAIVEQSGIAGLNELLLPECRIPVTNPAACEAAMERKRQQDAANREGRFGQPFIAPVLSATSFIPGVGTASSIATGLVTRLATEPIQPVRRTPMSFFDDIFGNFDSPADSGFAAGLAPDRGFDFGGLLQSGVNLATTLLAPRTQGMPANLAMSPALPAVVGAGGIVVRGAASAIAARLAAIGLTRQTAWTLLKQQGPAALLALGLTAAEVVHISRSGSGRRRMNMCNGRALRRAQRRLSAFHNFYKKTCGLPSLRSRKRKC